MITHSSLRRSAPKSNPWARLRGIHYPCGLYASASGTSFAAPMVASAAALYLVNHPHASPAQVRAALLALAEPGPIPDDPDQYPEGIVNLRQL